MELQISRSVCAKVPAEGILQGEASGNRKDPAAAMRMERGKSNRSKSMSGPHSYVRRDTAEDFGIKLYGIPILPFAWNWKERFGLYAQKSVANWP